MVSLTMHPASYLIFFLPFLCSFPPLSCFPEIALPQTHSKAFAIRFASGSAFQGTKQRFKDYQEKLAKSILMFLNRKHKYPQLEEMTFKSDKQQ